MWYSEYTALKVIEDRRKELERARNNGNLPRFSITLPINNRWTRARNNQS